MKEQTGYRYLIKNIGLLTLSSFSTKILSFFLVPLYTNVLTTEEYGTYDLFNATIGVLLPILTLNISEAIFRFSIDKKRSRDSIVTLGTKYLLIGNAFVLVGLIVNWIFGFSSVVSEYSVLFFLMFLVQAFSGALTCYTRGIDKVKELSISSVISSIVTILANILFLLVFKWGLVGYFIANIIGPAIQGIYFRVVD